MIKHFLTSLVNAGMVTIFTSLTMTYINTSEFIVGVWFTNWLISWSIVFTYVFIFANKIKNLIYGEEK